MKEQFNTEIKQGWSFGADAARITDENVCSEDRKHTSVILGNEARTARAWHSE